MPLRFADQPIERLMRGHWIHTSPLASLLDAERTMRLARIRELPVLVDDRLVGVVSHRELIHSLLERLLVTSGDAERHGLLRSVPVADVMDPNFPTATPDESIATVALRMVETRRPCLPIVVAAKDGEPARMVGLVAESDLLRLAYADAGGA